jgi:hypothetical protein
MSEDAFVGLVFCTIVAVLVYWHYDKKISRAQGGRGDRAENCGGYDDDDYIGPRRPYVVFNGELREVLHRSSSKDGLRVDCTLRPKTRGGNRPKVSVSKADVIWAEKGVKQ